jgi:hypothetical protein
MLAHNIKHGITSPDRLSRIMVLGSTQPLTEVSGIFLWGKARQARNADIFTATGVFHNYLPLVSAGVFRPFHFFQIKLFTYTVNEN